MASAISGRLALHWRLKQNIAGDPVSPFELFRLEASRFQRILKAETAQDFHRVGTDTHSRAHFAQRARLFKYLHLKTAPDKRDGRTEPTNSAADQA